MRPLAVLTGVVLGSSFAIGLGLLVVALLYGLNAGHDYIREDIPRLLGHAAIFCALTGVAATAFWGTIHQRRWLWLGQAALWLTLGLVVFYYWP